MTLENNAKCCIDVRELTIIVIIQVLHTDFSLCVCVCVCVCLFVCVPVFVCVSVCAVVSSPKPSKFHTLSYFLFDFVKTSTDLFVKFCYID